MLRYFIALLLFSFFIPITDSSAAVIITDTICKGDTVRLSTSFPMGTNVFWTPNYNISNVNSPSPDVYPQVTTTYIAQSSGLSGNLITNGNFSQGNTAFNSPYTYTTNLYPEFTYYVGSNPNTYHTGFSACADHTSSTGNMMIVNGSGTPNTVIWEQSITVVPNTMYQFSCWLTSVSPASPAILQFFINNQQIGPVFNATSTVCSWNMFFNTWNSGTATSAVISIRNQNTALGGNDFALDDISFAQVLALSDTHLVVVEQPSISLGNDTSICPDDTIILQAAPGFQSYTWSTGATSAAINAHLSGSYSVEVTTDKGCKASDTVQINHLAAPQVSVLNDTVCVGATAILSVITNPQNNISWDAGSSSVSLSVSPLSTTGYGVLVTDTSGCKTRDTAIAVVRTGPQVGISPDIGICRGDSATLTATGGQQYIWSPGGMMNAQVQVAPPDSVTLYSVVVTDQYQCTATASVEVRTIELPIPSIISTTDTICRGKEAYLEVSGGMAYLWSTGETGSAITVSPYDNTLYAVTVSNLYGLLLCSADTTLLQPVKSCNSMYIPNAMTVTGVNTIFKPVGEGLVFDEYRFSIYNRWGERLFITSDVNEGWDATYRGNIVPEGVYIYELIARGRGEKPLRLQGRVTVLK